MAGDLDPEVRGLLVCPRCRGELVDVERGLLCPADAVVYPVIEGIPQMIDERALRATPAERARR